MIEKEHFQQQKDISSFSFLNAFQSFSDFDL